MGRNRHFTDNMRRIIAFSILSYLTVSCGPREQSEQAEFTGIAVSELSGKELSVAHCSRCHAYVAPEVLPKSVWHKNILPAMGHRMGIYGSDQTRDSLYEASKSSAILRRANIFPAKAVLAREDWLKIEKYYIENAPDTIMPPVRKNNVRMGLRHFKYKKASYANRPPLTSMVRILPGRQGVAFSDSKGPRSVLTFLTPDLKENYSIPFLSTPVQLYETSNEIFLTTIGRGILPTDDAHGAIQRLTKNGSAYQPGSVAIPDLQRPVCTAFGDLNNDGLEDIVSCEFGNETGMLAWYENNGRGGYDKRVLREKPGTITAVIKDANGDGLPDIYALVAQGDEGIFLYENQGAGKFLEKRLLSFSPLNGSQYMEVVDFNKDGHDDILYVAGDNADKSPILKQYHGIYIFLNDGKSNFSQAYFYQMNGAYKAIVRDFDMDGDPDIAAISFFPDYLQYPEESFVYLENKGNLRFEDYSFPEASEGRWMVMDAGDLDGDGDIDLALGSYVYFIPAGDTTGLGAKWLKTSPSVVILENSVR